jgi:hypothetical protein
MEWTISAFSRSDLSDAKCPGFQDGPRFGGAAGLIPLASTDRGEHLFGTVDADSGEWRFLVCNGGEQDFYECRVSSASGSTGISPVKTPSVPPALSSILAPSSLRDCRRLPRNA